jgi:hypothetical protein
MAKSDVSRFLEVMVAAWKPKSKVRYAAHYGLKPSLPELMLCL